MPAAICLLGLDVGSTTTSLVVARVRRVRNSMTGRSEFGPPEFLAQPPAAFTPYRGSGIDLVRIEQLMDQWLADPTLPTIDAGGVLLTGLAAQSANGTELRERIRHRFGNTIVAAAPDARLESWLAFHGSCGRLSLANPGQTFLNLDVGGGTTNLALGRGGEVVATASLWIGARHLEFAPGTRRVIRATAVGERLLQLIEASPGDELTEERIQIISRFLADRLAKFSAGNAIEDWLVDAPWSGEWLPPDRTLFSGGVGELIYQQLAGTELPLTPFDDLGADLARAFSRIPLAGPEVPIHRGRATVMGITLHGTDLSGPTLFRSTGLKLPLDDVPILGTLDLGAMAWTFPHEKSHPLALRLTGRPESVAALKQFAVQLSAWLESIGSPTLVLLLESDLGKTLGSYLTDWGNSPRSVIALDELDLRAARFVRIGVPRSPGIPVTFYGLI